MNWKQFLKLNRRKVFLTIIILLILFPIEIWYLFGFGPGGTMLCGTALPISESTSNPIYNEESYSLPWERCSQSGYPDLLTSILIVIFWPLFIIGNFVISYLLTCFIAWI